MSKAIDKARAEDLEPSARVARWLVDHMTARGVSRRDVSEHFNAANAAQQWTTHWTDRAVKPRVPRWEQWQELRHWLDLPDDMDAEVWRLNGRKGKPGDNFYAREILSIREVGDIRNGRGREYGGAMFAGEQTGKIEHKTTAPATEAAQQWQGWGTALKPGFEPVVVARKPLVGNVAQNVLAYGTGALNVDACRIGTTDHLGGGGNGTGRIGNFLLGGFSSIEELRAAAVVDSVTPDGRNRARAVLNRALKWENKGGAPSASAGGRWPANVVLDEDQAAALDQQSGTMRDGVAVQRNGGGRKIGSGLIYSGSGGGNSVPDEGYGSGGGASRFFYVAKAPKSERPVVDGIAHPTVKPLALMRWLVRLVTPPGGTVLDPFAGSGTTVEAAILEGFDVIGIEREADYLPLIQARIFRAQATVDLAASLVPDQPDLFGEPA